MTDLAVDNICNPKATTTTKTWQMDRHNILSISKFMYCNDDHDDDNDNNDANDDENASCSRTFCCITQENSKQISK